MKTFSDRLAMALKDAQETQAGLANAVGVKQQAINYLCKRGKGSVHSPAIARHLGVSLRWLTEGIGEMHSSVSPMHGNTEIAHVPPSTRRAPVISWVQAGSWTEAIDLYQPGFSEEWEDVNACDSPNVFWLRVVGDSMTRPHGISVPEGYLIKVDPDRQADNGSLVVAKLTESQDATFKKLVIDAGRKLLMPLNERYDPIPINGNCRIVGVVTEIKLKLG